MKHLLGTLLLTALAIPVLAQSVSESSNSIASSNPSTATFHFPDGAYMTATCNAAGGSDTVTVGMPGDAEPTVSHPVLSCSFGPGYYGTNITTSVAPFEVTDSGRLVSVESATWSVHRTCRAGRGGGCSPWQLVGGAASIDY